MERQFVNDPQRSRHLHEEVESVKNLFLFSIAGSRMRSSWFLSERTSLNTPLEDYPVIKYL